ncbi:putative histone-lysine N-methyltransferase ATXR2 [Paratrimastix pyriformis]|uniref:Histone-lysine N-methyltransferase ATXR2 n=1 Tax=Paratrimastix pyriformis TaxID=342808 RepID=A0ABQ8UEB8_9EUKA|nr:putative histone-lysine N-methyltransferase ATXR2 [Paratrimastix pyriformis]
MSRAAGNAAFKAGEFEAAANAYAAAIEELRNGGLASEVAICLSNKAAALLKLRRFENALSDVEAACAALNYAGESEQLVPLQAKLRIRKGEALSGLQRHEAALVAFQEALSFDPRNAFAATGIAQEEIALFYQPAVRSSPVEVRLIDAAHGRGLFARARINEGDVLFRERPILCLQHRASASRTRCCTHCLRYTGSLEEQMRAAVGPDSPATRLGHPECAISGSAPIECPSCSAVFCCPACRDEAQAYHALLCSREKTGACGTAIRSLEPALKAALQHFLTTAEAPFLLAARILAVIVSRLANGTPFDVAARPFSLLCHRPWTSIIRAQFEGSRAGPPVALAEQPWYREWSGYRDMVAEASRVLGDVFQAQCPALPQHVLTAEYFDELVGAVALNSTAVGVFHPFETYLERVGMVRGSDCAVAEQKKYGDLLAQHGGIPRAEGIGIFLIHSTINHSCAPNAEHAIYRNEPAHQQAVVNLVALRRIEKDDQITISYLSDEEAAAETPERRKMLQDDYGFVCDCSKCTRA